MSVSSDVIGAVLKSVYTKYPQLVLNKTLTQIFTTIASNATILNGIVQASGVDIESLRNTLQTYIAVIQYMYPPPSAPTLQPNVTKPNSTECVAEGQGAFTNLCLIPAFMIIILFSFLSQRRNTKKCCGVVWKRPGLCIPVNLVDSYENRFGFACAFGATVTKCLTILFFSDYDETFSQEIKNLQQDPSTPSWTGIFWKMLAMLIIGVAYYPMFACMATDYKVLGGVIGCLYASLWLFMKFAFDFQCPDTFVSVVFPGDNFAFSLPIYICLILLVLIYLYNVVRGLIKWAYRRKKITAQDYEVEELKESYKYNYVVQLLRPVPKEFRDTNFKEKLKSKIYKWKPDFKYSSRVVCTYFVALIFVYQVGVLLVMLGGLLYSLAINIIITTPELALLVDQNLLVYWVFIGFVAWFVALGISAIYSVLLVTNMLSWYRGHIARLQQGDRSFLPVDVLEKSPSSITVATLKYSGYQVAYLAWSFIFMHVLLFVIGTVLGIQVIHPITIGKSNSFLLTQILKVWPAILVSTVFFLCQFLLSKFVFLHDRGSSIALDNRRLFHICTYFLFFFNIFLGVVSCVKRILIGTIIGVMFLGRLQKSLVPRDFELKDPGYNAYIGYLYLEHTHSNPVLVVFCRVIMLVVRNKRQTSEDNEDIEVQNRNEFVTIQNRTEMNSSPYSSRVRTRIRNRWALLYTLHNNPSLAQHRRPGKYINKSAFHALGVMMNDVPLVNVVSSSPEESGRDAKELQTEEEVHIEEKKNDEDLQITPC